MKKRGTTYDYILLEEECHLLGKSHRRKVREVYRGSGFGKGTGETDMTRIAE